MSSFRDSNLAQAWLVLVLATLFGTALAGIQTKLSPVIEANKARETMEKIPGLVPGDTGADGLVITPRVIDIKKNGIQKYYSVYDVVHKDGTPIGHVAKASAQGYADKIEILIGLDDGGDTITGLFVLDQKETPGLGNKILEKKWRDQFINKRSDRQLLVVKGGAGKAYEVDAISGATISSRAVTGMVNTTIADIKPRLILPVNEETMKIEETE